MKPNYQHRKNYNEPGHAHELTFSCYGRLPLLAENHICNLLRDSIDQARVDHDFDLWAYVFMPEHGHLLIWPRQPSYDIAVIRRAIKEPVGRRAIAHLERSRPDWIAQLTRTRGKRVERLFWQSGGGYDRNVTDSATLLTILDYIHLNPVRRMLVDHAGDWEWSSARWFESGGPSLLRLDPIPSSWLDMDG